MQVEMGRARRLCLGKTPHTTFVFSARGTVRQPYGTARATARGAARWERRGNQLPLLDLPDHLKPGIYLSLTLPMDQFGFPIFQSLYYNGRQGKCPQ